MREGADALDAARPPRGLAHGREALSLLEKARTKFRGEKQAMQAKLDERKMNLRAMLLLYRMLAEQNKVNAATVEADKVRAREPGRFNRLASDLAERQSGIRGDAEALKGLFEKAAPPAAAYVEKLGEKIDLSRLALSGGDTGRATRVVQGQIVAMLEKLLKDCSGGGAGAVGKRMQAIGQAMGRTPAFGSQAGVNDPTRLPAAVDATEDPSWTRVRARYEESLAAGREADYPPEFRGLVNAYFDRLRREWR
jgi:hypothetical protein